MEKGQVNIITFQEPQKPMVFITQEHIEVRLSDECVVTVHSDGRVEAPTIEASGEAGKTFVQAMILALGKNIGLEPIQ